MRAAISAPLRRPPAFDLIIDDTPEAITLSSFDQTRREVARMTLERLIGDGRIHPARIEETVEKCRHDLELQMKREGERAVMELASTACTPTSSSSSAA